VDLCVVGIISIGYIYLGSVIKSIQILNHAKVNSTIELRGVIIVIDGFFFIGGKGFTQKVIGPNATCLLNDIGLWWSVHIPLSKFSIILTQTAVGIITGLDGSGFQDFH